MTPTLQLEADRFREVPVFRFVAAALLEFAVFDLLRLIGGLRAVRWALRHRPSKPLSTPPEALIKQIRLATRHALVLYMHRTLCLQRSFVVTRLLRRHGINADLVTGYLPAPLTAHAWVEVDGVIVADEAKRQRFHIVLDRL